MKPTLLALASLLLLASLPANAATHYEVKHRYVLGGEGGWDILTYDQGHNRLYITRATHVIVVDPLTGKQVGDIPDTPGVHAVAIAPESGRGFITAGKANKALIFDLNTLKTTGSVETGDKPDFAIYEPITQRVFTFNAGSNDATAIDSKAEKVVCTIALVGKPEFAVDDGRGDVFVNLESTNELVKFDPSTLKVTNRWPLKGCDEPTGLAIDAAHNVLFSACGNKLMFVTDAKTGNNIAQVPIGDRVDGAAFDPGKKLTFSPNGEGSLTVISGKKKTYKVEQTVTTQKGARTIALNPNTHEIYLVTSEFEPPPADKPNSRPTPKPGTFTLLVLGEK